MSVKISCDLVGCKKRELLSKSRDLYVRLVHPADRKRYIEWMERARSAEQTLTAEYRLMKKDGTVIYVKDTMTVRRLANGALVGDSVLTDITELKNENLQFLDETIPCGFLKYTCEKQPKVTYINKRMIEFLRFPEARDGEMDYVELYKDNIFLMIPIEERRKFAPVSQTGLCRRRTDGRGDHCFALRRYKSTRLWMGYKMRE